MAEDDPYAKYVGAGAASAAPAPAEADPYAKYVGGTAKRGSFYGEIPKMVTDIPFEINKEKAAAMEMVKNPQTPAWAGSAANVGERVAGFGRYMMSPVTGTLRSVGGHGMAAGLHAVGKGIEATGVFGDKDITANDDPSKFYEMGKNAVDTAVSAAAPMSAGKTSSLGTVLGHVTPPTAPVAPAPGPLGVTEANRQVLADAEAGKFGDAGRKRAAEYRAQEAKQVAQAHEDITKSSSPTGQVEAATPVEAGEIARPSLQAKAQASKADVDTRFEAARGMGGAIHGGSAVQSGDVVRAKLAAPGPDRALLGDHTPNTNAMLDLIDKRTAALNGSHMPLEDVNQLRQDIGELKRDAWAKSPKGEPTSDARAAGAAYRAFNEHINASVNSGDFVGPPGARQAWNDAVAASAKHKATFGGDDKVGSVVKDIIGHYRSPEMTANDVVDRIYGASGVNPSSLNVGVANRLKGIYGENSREWGAIKQGLFSRLTERGPGQTPYTPQQAADRLNKFLNGDGKEMANTLLSPQDRVAWQQFANMQRNLDVPKSLANHPEVGAVKQVLDYVRNKTAQVIGGALARVAGVGTAGEIAAGVGAGLAERATGAIARARQMGNVRQALPLVNEQLANFQRALAAHAKANSGPSAAQLSAATINLSKALRPLGINLEEALVHAGAAEPQGDTVTTGRPRIETQPKVYH